VDLGRTGESSDGTRGTSSQHLGLGATVELELTTDQEFFAETTRKFLASHADVTAVRSLRHDERGFSPTVWRQGCDLGWSSLLVSEADGGGSISGSGLADLALVAYEFGRHAAPGPLIATNLVASALSRGGSNDHKRDLLRGILTGEVIASWAHAESQPNGWLCAPTVCATEEGDGWRIDGFKTAVEAGAVAQFFLVSARVGGGIGQFVVPAGNAGVTVRSLRSVDLTRRFASVTFEAVHVSPEAAVGQPGDASEDLRRQSQLANVMLCAEMVGAMDKAMEITVEWAFNRYTFGRPLASYQALKHRFADMKTWLEASHALADAAAEVVGRGSDDADEMVSGAKAYIGHYGPELCQECVQMHGGIGVTFDHDMHLYLRRVALDATVCGTVTDHRLRLAEILDARA
jgi:alkylation response protein AidB-like acyl-CoA dehydrogenase